jgi:hypothetical protein
MGPTTADLREWCGFSIVLFIFGAKYTTNKELIFDGHGTSIRENPCNRTEDIEFREQSGDVKKLI